jgi:superoxide dismutase, Cu-Zn family
MMRTVLALTLAVMFPVLTLAESVVVPIHGVTAEGTGKNLGHVQIKETEGQITLLPALKDLAPGLHGFHIHENPSCSPLEKDGRMTAALGAGAHYDPDHSGKHQGPEGQGHRGDLPALSVSSDGTAATGLIQAPRLTLRELHGRSLIIHAEPDNYSDQPGGARIACGIIP